MRRLSRHVNVAEKHIRRRECGDKTAAVYIVTRHLYMSKHQCKRALTGRAALHEDYLTEVAERTRWRTFKTNKMLIPVYQSL